MTWNLEKAGHIVDAEMAQRQAFELVDDVSSAGALSARAQDTDWPVLEPLVEPKATAPAAFPFDALGRVLGAAAAAIARDVQAPDSLAGGSVLAAAALAVQPHANVLLPHGQRSPLSLFVLTGAASGDRKSAVDAVACRAVDEVRKQQAREHAQAQANYAIDAAERRQGAAVPAPPLPKSLIVSNATVEGLHRLLLAQSSIGVFTAEGGEFLGGHSMREERRAAGYAFYLKGWSGEALDAVRGGTGTSVLLGRRMSMHIMVQPLPLRMLLSDPLAQNQGLHARCLIAQPESLAGSRMYKKVDPNDDPAVLLYQGCLRQLLETPPATFEQGDGNELQPRDLPLDDAATDLWVYFYDEIEREQAADGELEGAKPFASKAAEHAARLAAIITLVQHPEAQEVGSEAMYGGITLARFYLSEHVRLTHAGRRERVEKPLWDLLLWLQERSKKTRRVSHDDVLQKTPMSIRGLKAEGIKPLLEQLQGRGYIRRSGEGWEVRQFAGSQDQPSRS